MITFEESATRLLGHEGRYVFNPKDPGGETNWGISKRSYPHVDIKNLTKEGALEIYMRDFWKPLTDAHPAIRFQAFDFAVNSGIQTATRKLQQAVGVADDGHWGPRSAAALANQLLDHRQLRSVHVLRFVHNHEVEARTDPTHHDRKPDLIVEAGAVCSVNPRRVARGVEPRRERTPRDHCRSRVRSDGLADRTGSPERGRGRGSDR